MKKHVVWMFIVVLCVKTPYSFECTMYDSSNSILPNAWFNDLAVAPNGDIWCLSTLYGVYVFDGIQWKSLPASADNLGLDTYVSYKDILFDREGYAWIATSEGLIKYRNEDWIIYDTGNSGILSNNVLKIAAGPDNRIWIEGRQGSFDYLNIVVFDGSSWDTLSPMPENVSGSEILDFAFGDSVVWMGCRIGILEYKNDSYTAYPKAVCNLWTAHVAIKDPHNESFWFAGIDGIVNRTGNAWVFTNHTDAFGLPFDTPYSSIVPYESFFWISFPNGLMKFDPEMRTAEIYSDSNSCLPVVNSFTEIVRDNINNLWLGTSNGVVRISMADASVENDRRSGTGRSVNFTCPTVRNTTLEIFNPFADNAQHITFKIVDVMGRELRQGTLAGKSCRLNIADFTWGKYFLVCNCKHTSRVAAFLVN